MTSTEPPIDNGRILKSLYDDIDNSAVNNKTIIELLWGQLPKWRNATALECGLTGKKYTYDDCYNLSRGFATSLLKCGARKQDICGLLAPNSPELILAILGTWDAGCIVDVINPNLPGDEIYDRLVRLKTKHFVVHSTMLPLLEKFKESGFTLENIIVISREGSLNCNFKDMCSEKQHSKNLLKGGDIDTEKYVAVLGNTSGTTGKSKIVTVTHRNYISALRQFTTFDIMDFPSFEEGRIQPVVIGMLPLFHTYGLFITTIFSLHQGAKIVVIPKFEQQLYFKLLKIHKPTVLHLISPLVELLTKSPDVTPEDFENCKSIFVAFRNFSISEPVIQRFQSKANKSIVFQEGWGCTEALIATIRNPSFKNTKIGTVGRLLPNVVGKVVDINTGKLLGPNEKGEICVKGPQMSLGYYNDTAATEKLFDSQGFIRSGDFGYYDEDQCFYIIDRIVDLIKVGNNYVSPTKLEIVLRKHPDVLDVVIFGFSDDGGEEKPRAHIIRKDGSSATEQDFVDYFRSQVQEDYKQLTGGVVFTDNIPRTATGKTLRRELRTKHT